MTLGIAVGSIFLPYMADKFGRKTLLLLSIALTIPVLAASINVTSAAVAYTAVFFWGFTCISRYTILFVWASELFPPGHGTFAITALRAMIGTSLFLMNFYFMFISRSIHPALAGAYLVSAIVCLQMFWMPESPKWLLSVGGEQEAIKSF